MPRACLVGHCQEGLLGRYILAIPITPDARECDRKERNLCHEDLSGSNRFHGSVFGR
jgi:hypothetical protein